MTGFGICSVCRQVQRLYDGIVLPHAIPTLWQGCFGAGQVSAGMTDREPAPETLTVGEVTDAEMINLLACAVIGYGWTVTSGTATLPPVTVAILLVQAMVRGSATGGTETR